jgi:glycosyltransferase involved in cell wall biosynthesis
MTKGPAEPSSVAIVHDWLYTYAGAERVLEQILECFPDAEVFALIDCIPPEERGFLRGKRVHTSFLQRLPFPRRLYQKYLPLMPAAIENMDLRAYDLVVSSSSGVAKGILTHSKQLHICYLQSRSLRYLYDERFAYLPARFLIPLQEVIMSRLRTWDYVASHRPDATIANSDFVRKWHRHRYGIESNVIYPPVNVELFADHFKERKEDYYVLVSRFAKYKRVALVVEAFNRMGKPLVVVGDGPEHRSIKRMARKNVELTGRLNPASVAKIVGGAAAFVYAGQEDFGVSFVEAQATGTPVIAYAQGGVREIVHGLDESQPTGVLFYEQTPEAIVAAVKLFEQHIGHITAAACAQNAARFSPERFRREFSKLVQDKWESFASF